MICRGARTTNFIPQEPGTKSIMTGAFDEWGIPTKGYSGPNVSHEKMKYSSSYVSDMLLDVLDDAYKKGGGNSSSGRRRGMQMWWSVARTQMFMCSGWITQNLSASQ